MRKGKPGKRTKNIRKSSPTAFPSRSKLLYNVMLKLVQLVRRAVIAAPPLMAAGIFGVLLLSAPTVRAGGDVEGCTEDDFDAAVLSGDLVTFTQDCTITITMPISIGIDTTIDAQGHNVVLSGDNALQLF